jgi:drug/metabolite transporter (DMT)-like permease
MTVPQHVTATVALIVIGAGGLHASWNAIIKYIDDGLVAFGLMGVVMTVGGGLGLLVTGLPYAAAIPFVLGSVVIHVAYQLGLMQSYRIGAFNQTYPIARGTSPLVVAVGGYFLADEHLGPGPWAGVSLLAVGLMSLAFSAGRLSRADLPAVGAAVLTGLTIAGYTLVDGLGVRRAHDPYAYTCLLFLLQGPVFPVLVLVRRPLAVWRELPTVAKGTVAGLLSVVAYGAVLWAQTKAPLAEVAALRETSVITAAVLGAVFLKEQFGSRRLAAAVMVAGGIALIAF